MQSSSRSYSCLLYTSGAVTIATNMAGRGTDIKLDDEAKAAGGLKIIGTEPVSYTHLDVYKRQVYASMWILL